VLTGLGATVFRPAVFGLLPAAVAPQRRMAATALYSAVQDAGLMVGPALAAVVIALGGASALFGRQRRRVRRLSTAALPRAARVRPRSGAGRRRPVASNF
jgi:MFS family permease